MHVHEWIYETPEALSELLTFPHTQDGDFHHLLLDPRNGSGRLIPSVYHESNAQGVGLMYRLVDVRGMFHLPDEGDFGSEACTLRLTIDDAFLPENGGSCLLRFEGGCVQRADDGPHDVEIDLNVAICSSLLAGTAGFRALCNYGLAAISDKRYVDLVDRLFAVARKPVCLTAFWQHP